jgi:hypothetical protein
MIITKILALSLTALLFACASSTPTPAPTPPAQLAQDRGYELGKPIDRIMNYRLDSWNYINPQAVIIHAGGNRDRCHELMNTEVLATTSTGSAMRAKFDAIIVSLAGSRLAHSTSSTRKCYIEAIYLISRVKTPSK